MIDYELRCVMAVYCLVGAIWAFVVGYPALAYSFFLIQQLYAFVPVIIEMLEAKQ